MSGRSPRARCLHRSAPPESTWHTFAISAIDTPEHQPLRRQGLWKASRQRVRPTARTQCPICPSERRWTCLQRVGRRFCIFTPGPQMSNYNREGAMKQLISSLGVVALIVSSSLLVCAQSNVKIIVLPQHEENFRKLTSWLRENELFKRKSDFIKSVSETFRHAKDGNIEQYVHWLEVFKSELAKLSDAEKNELVNFMLSSLTPVEGEMSQGTVGCRVDCLFTSCEIACPSSELECQCHWFFADCRCEP